MQVAQALVVQAVLDGDKQRVELLHGDARILKLQQRFADACAPQHALQPFLRGQPLAACPVQQAMHGKDGSGEDGLQHGV